MRGAVAISLLCILGITSMVACKTKSKAGASKASIVKEAPAAKEEEKVSNISLYDKPLDVIKANVIGQKWQLIYSVGGMTGKDENTFEHTFYTFSTDNKLIVEDERGTKKHPYKWKYTRDIYTGDSVYVLSGVVNWKINGIVNDTLQVADNYVDGYSYGLIRAE